MERYSHSKLEVMKTCPLQFKFKYIDKIKIEDKDKSAAHFGELVHKIAENYKGGGKEELLALYHEYAKDIPLTDEYRAKVSLALNNIHEYWSKSLVETKSVKHEEDITVSINENIELTGKIDVFIEYTNGRFKIVDYKTNKSKEYANHTDQLSMYILLLNKKYGIPYDSIDCEIVYLALEPKTKKGIEVPNKGFDNITKVYKIGETDLECLTMEIEMIDKAIQSSLAKNEWNARPGKWTCKFCKYEPICDKKYIEEEF